MRIECNGGGHIVGPTGKLLAGPASLTDDDVLFAQLDLDEIDEAREKFPFTRDLKPELYQEIFIHNLADTR